MVYVLSDIHGNERRFNSILEQINLQSDDILYILGDVVDRHPEGIRILRKIMKMPNVKMLLGNHEYMMLNALGCPYDAADDTNELLQRKALRLWYSNGGKVTHDSLKHLRKTQRLEIVEFLRAHRHRRAPHLRPSWPRLSEQCRGRSALWPPCGHSAPQASP